MDFMQIIEGYVFLHSPKIQEQIRQSEDEIKSGRCAEFNANEIDKMLDWLHSEDRGEDDAMD